jgi:iron(III) transport system permease protein
LGAKPSRTFLQVALPLARPGLAAGGALALMEIVADYGAAQHFGLTTLSTAIFRSWGAHGSTQTAIEISAMLLIAALVFLAIERGGRGRASFANERGRWRPLARVNLPPLGAAGASVFCAALVFFGAGLPLAWLARLALLHAGTDTEALMRALGNSLMLASIGAGVTLFLAALIANAGRHGGAAGRAASLAAAMSYAAPGAVAALGALSLFGLAREAGLIGGLGGALGFAALIWVYAARFAAAGAQPIESGLARLSRGLDHAARTLGASPLQRLLRVDLPIAAPAAAAAALIVFVEILKELPATLILRPFNTDTLAVLAYAYASDERLLQAAAPALLVFLAGLAPMLILTRAIICARAGTR